MKPEEVIVYPIMTERTVSLIERENKLVFIVSRTATKQAITEAVEQLYQVEVENVTTMITRKGGKKAFVRLSPKSNASDLAIRLGIL